MFILPHLKGLTAANLGSAAFKGADLDLKFAANKSLVDSISGNSLVSFTRAGSAANAATYVDSSGVLQRAVTNLLLRSEEFDDAAWTATNSTFSPNATIAPNGTLTADKHIPGSGIGIGTGASQTRVYQTPSFVSGLVYTFSIYAKQGEYDQIALAVLTSPSVSAIYSLTLGTVVPPVAGATIDNVGNGWYRCSLTFTATSTSAFQVRWSASSSTISFGDGVSGIFAWGAQLEQSSTVGEYVPTVAAINSAPRFDHNPTTGESLGLLVEEPRTNNFTYSEDTSQWLTPTNITLSQNQTTAPDNLVTADQYLETTATGLHVQDSVAFAFVTSTVYTYSVFVKSIGGRNFEIGYPPTIFTNRFARFNLSGSGSVQGSDAGVTASIQAYANGWYRCSATNTCASGASSRIGNFIIDGSFSRSYAGDITKGLFIWGAQLEAGAFPTSYIPTLGTPGGVTRAADVASITGAAFSSFYNQTEGTVFADINTAPVANIAQALFDLSEGVGSERMFQRRNTGGFISTAITDNNVVQGDFGSVQVSASGRARSGFAYRLNDFEAAVNGSTSGTDTSATVPTPDRIHIGQNFASAQVVNGTIKRLTYWPTRLSNTVLQAITQ